MKKGKTSAEKSLTSPVKEELLKILNIMPHQYIRNSQSEMTKDLSKKKTII